MIDFQGFREPLASVSMIRPRGSTRGRNGRSEGRCRHRFPLPQRSDVSRRVWRFFGPYSHSRWLPWVAWRCRKGQRGYNPQNPSVVACYIAVVGRNVSTIGLNPGCVGHFASFRWLETGRTADEASSRRRQSRGAEAGRNGRPRGALPGQRAKGRR